MGAAISLPGQSVIARNYGERMVLYTAADRVEAVVDGAQPGKNGRLFIIEPNKPMQVPYEAGRFILEHLAYTGVVRVEESQQLDEEGNVVGISYDVEGAKAASLALSATSDKQRFDQYVRDCVSDYIANPKGAKPVPQPSPPILAIIERRGYDLKKFGIVPIGWEEPAKDKRLEQMEAQLKHMQALLDAQGVAVPADLDVPGRGAEEGVADETPRKKKGR